MHNRTSTLAAAFAGCTLILAAAAACGPTASSTAEDTAEDGPTRDTIDTAGMTLYQVNTRQYTDAGTFDAFRAHLPRLRDMGVDVLWFMPIHPIGELNRKGSLGSPYAVEDYRAINPEFGDEQDFRELVHAAHDAGMLVILDWVANHTAWDHIWTETDPERYLTLDSGEFTPPNDEWLDVIDLNFDEPQTREAMRDAMLYWVREFDVDGFRADVAELVPQDFWHDTIAELRDERPMFMLAEGAEPWLHAAGFDATYGWGLGDTLLRIANGEADAADLRAFIDDDQARIAAADPGAFRMHFTSNHDWNSWNGVAVERFGDAWRAATVLTFTLPGMPLIYNGQEAGIGAQLAFFEKDQINWRPHPAADLYRRLAVIKETEPALHHGDHAGELHWLDVGDPQRVVAFRRSRDRSRVIVLANLSDEPARIDARAVAAALGFDGNITADARPKPFLDLFGFPTAAPNTLGPWHFRVLTPIK